MRKEQRIKIHYITNSYNPHEGGAQLVVRWLHLDLQGRGVESGVLGLCRYPDADINGCLSLGLKNPYAPQAFYGVYRYVKDNVRSGDVIHVHLFPSILFVALMDIFCSLDCPLVFTEHSTSNRRRGTTWGKLLDSMIYSRYEYIIAISRGVERKLLEWQPHLYGKTRVIYNGVPLTFDKMVRRSSKKRVAVLSVGSLRRAKNYDGALRAVALLKNLDFEYWVAGSGECEKELRTLCRELGLESRVRFLGYVAREELPRLLASADIFLMPSLWEGFGLAAVEAMNASLPLVVSDVPGLREIVGDDPPCAIFVDPESPESIAQALCRLLVSHELRAELGANSFQKARRFSRERMVENHLKFYEELVFAS